MLRDLLQKSQSDSGKDDKQENRNPTSSTGDKSTTSPSRTHPQKDDDEFVPVSHEDVEDLDDDHDKSEMERVLRPFLGLQRQGQRTRGGAANKYDNLHPYTQILSLSDLEACIAVEEAAFPEHERCSREKVCLTLQVSRDLPTNSSSAQILASQRSNGSRSLHSCDSNGQMLQNSQLLSLRHIGLPVGLQWVCRKLSFMSAICYLLLDLIAQ